MKFRIVLVYLIWLLLSPFFSYEQCPSATSVSIDTIVTTESRCQSSGTATVHVVNGAAPYWYSIISGPVTAPTQSDSLFQSLAPGNYTVKVTDNCGMITTDSFTVTGSYADAVSTFYTYANDASCGGANDGSIYVYNYDIGGRAPFSYSLIAPSPIIKRAQSSGYFDSLVTGVYTCRVIDSCGNYQTISVTLPKDTANLNFDYTFNGMSSPANMFLWESCDSTAVRYNLYSLNSSLGYPYKFNFPVTVTLKLPNSNSYTHILDSTFLDSTNTIFATDTFYFRYHHISGIPDTCFITATDICGNTVTDFYLMECFDLANQYINPSGCNKQYSYNLDYYYLNSLMFCDTVHYYLYNSNGILVASQINNSIFSGFPSGTGYRIVRQDCCQTDSNYLFWDTVPSLKIIEPCDIPTGSGCHEGIISGSQRFPAFIYTAASYQTEIVDSGPASVTLKNGRILYYTYPDTIALAVYNDSLNAYTDWLGKPAYVKYYTAGTYQVCVLDTCGQKSCASITIKPSDLRHTTFPARIEKGCSSNNKIIYSIGGNGTGSISLFKDSVNLFWLVPNQAVSPGIDSIVNPPSGTYYLHYQYVNYFGGFIDTLPCDEIIDTIIIPPYTTPMFTVQPAITVCGNTYNVALVADSSTGVPPYQFQIVSGTYATPFQSSSLFTNLPKGTYSFLMEDACGNSYIRDVSVDGFIIPPITTAGNACQGNSVTFTAPSSPYYSYVWKYPNGTINTADSITINPITKNDTGIYTITVTSNINGCSNTKSELLKLNFCSPVFIVPDTIKDCKPVTFRGITYTSSTVITDTIKSIGGIDSVYLQTNIIIQSTVPVIQNIYYSGCNSYTYKGITYTTPTVLIDTITNMSGCDSVLKIISITPIIPVNETLSFASCGSYIYNGITYTSSTVLNQTLKSTGGCDSVYKTITITIAPITPVSQTLSFTGCDSYAYKGITYSNSTILNDTLKSIGGCDSIYQQINIIITPSPTAPTVNNVAYCQNDKSTPLTATGTSLLWYNTATGGTGSSTAPTPITSNSGIVSYYVTQTNGSCESQRAKIDVTVNSLPVVASISGNNMLYVGATETLTDATAGGVWSNSNNASATIDETGLVNGLIPGNTTIYYTVTTSDSCSSQTSFDLTVQRLLNNNFYIPNAFTPNNDGKNDVFKVYGSYIKTMQLKIFNQWGELIFESNDINNGWDGTQRGRLQPTGVYIYIVKVTFIDNQTINKTGSINLIR